ncbi:MAG TPA: hypothetical protein VF187_05875 [Gemmatimonadales bacterium]
MDVVNLQERLSRLSTHWGPKTVGELNGQHVKLVKFQGPFVWHRREAEEVHVLLFEPVSTLNTGNTVGPRTVARPERL